MFCKKLIRSIKGKWFRSITKNQFTPIIKGKLILENKNIIIGKNVTFYNNVKLWGNGEIIIGDNVKIGDNTMIYATKNEGGVTIGSNSIIAANCYIIDMNHGTLKDILIMDQPADVSPVKIGDDCWLAEDVTVLKGTTLEKGCVCGAKALVKGHYPENSIIVGIPGKVIRERM